MLIVKNSYYFLTSLGFHFIILIYLIVSWDKIIKLKIDTYPPIKVNVENFMKEHNSDLNKEIIKKTLLQKKNVLINKKSKNNDEIKKIIKKFPKNKLIEEKKLVNEKKVNGVNEIKTSKKPIIISKFSETENDVFEKYKNELRYLIQKTATENYPRISIRKKEQGKVELQFMIDIEGNIKNIKVLSKTNASDRLINSSKKTLNILSPYKKNDILIKKNIFTIIIFYKL